MSFVLGWCLALMAMIETVLYCRDAEALWPAIMTQGSKLSNDNAALYNV